MSFSDEYPSVQPQPSFANSRLGGGHMDDDKAQRLVVEVQRSLDVWDRTWSSLPLSGLRVYAGERSAELATWLARQLGQTVVALDVAELFLGFDAAPLADQGLCLPLLGVLLRHEGPAA
jgi:MSHA biogenesis protein MshI